MDGLRNLMSCTLAFRLEIGRNGKDGTDGWTDGMGEWLDGCSFGFLCMGFHLYWVFVFLFIYFFWFWFFFFVLVRFHMRF